MIQLKQFSILTNHCRCIISPKQLFIHISMVFNGIFLGEIWCGILPCKMASTLFWSGVFFSKICLKLWRKLLAAEKHESGTAHATIEGGEMTRLPQACTMTIAKKGKIMSFMILKWFLSSHFRWSQNNDSNILKLNQSKQNKKNQQC